MRRRSDSVSITSARTPRSTDIRSRQTRYIVSMGIRTACFVGAVATEGVLRWVLFAGALFLPYVAVVLANAGVQKQPPPPQTYHAPSAGELRGGSAPPQPPRD